MIKSTSTAEIERRVNFLIKQQPPVLIFGIEICCISLKKPQVPKIYETNRIFGYYVNSLSQSNVYLNHTIQKTYS